MGMMAEDRGKVEREEGTGENAEEGDGEGGG